MARPLTVTRSGLVGIIAALAVATLDGSGEAAASVLKKSACRPVPVAETWQYERSCSRPVGLGDSAP